MPNWTRDQLMIHDAKTGKKSTVNKSWVESKASEREKDLHIAIILECRRMGFAFVHSRMDRATTQSKGVPDFIIALPEGKTIWIECKSKSGKKSPEQMAFDYHLRKLEHRSYEVRSLDDFTSILRDMQ